MNTLPFRLRTTVAILMLAMAGITFAQETVQQGIMQPSDIPQGEAGRYYQQGAAAGMDALNPKSTYSRSFSVGARPRAGLTNSCGSLDFYANFEAELKNLQYKLENTIKGAQKAIMASVSGAISSFFQYQLMKINPVLGQLTTKQLDEYIELFNLQVRECKDYERDAANGKNPLDEIIKIGVADKWKVAIGAVNSGLISLEEAEAKLYEDARKDGVPMPDGKSAGGEGQDPIDIIKSLITVGMNLDLGRDDKGKWQQPFDSSVQALTDNPILKEFKSPQDLAQFAQDVYGSKSFRIGKDAENTGEIARSVPGRGYEFVYLEYRNQYAPQLRAYVAGEIEREKFDRENPYIIIPEAEIDDIRLMTPFQKDMEIDRRAQDYAGKRLTENLLYLKKALVTGMYSPDLQISGMKAPTEDAYRVLYYKIQDDIREIKQRLYQY